MSEHQPTEGKIKALGNAGAGAGSLRHALKRLIYMARTSGGTAGPDRGLMEACEQAELLLVAFPSPPQGEPEIVQRARDYLRDAGIGLMVQSGKSVTAWANDILTAYDAGRAPGGTRPVEHAWMGA